MGQIPVQGGIDTTAGVLLEKAVEPEGFGRTLAEAAAMGKPVIATAHGAAPEVVVNGETGWLAPPGKAGPMAQALGQVFAMSAKERERLAAKAMHRARSQFSKLPRDGSKVRMRRTAVNQHS